MKIPSFPVVAIIGRTNVGKSTLFNRLIEKKKALVSKMPGTTRDRNYGLCNWRGKYFYLVDTGGLLGFKPEKQNKTNLEEKIIEQVNFALKEADLVLFLLDSQTSVFPQDKEIASRLRRENKPTILVANKVDNPRRRKTVNPDIFRLGFSEICLVSALNGAGIGDLLDEIIKKIKFFPTDFPNEKEWIRVAILGKPNVGKSSILNSILGEEKVIVSEIPHTTRSPQDTLIIFQKKPILLIDTAGIRRKAKIDNFIEKEGVKLSLRSLKESDIVLIILEAHLPLTRQDKRLVNLALRQKKSVILIGNKWDLVADKNKEQEYRNYLLNSLPSFPFLPIIITSAKTGFNTEKILPLVIKISQERKKIIEQKELDKIIAQLSFPRPKRKKIAKIYSLSQKKTNFPYFVLTVNKKELLPSAIPNLIKKKIREKFNFLGTPIVLAIKEWKK